MTPTNEQYVAILGDASETSECFGPFDSVDKLLEWTKDKGPVVSVYRIMAAE